MADETPPLDEARLAEIRRLRAVVTNAPWEAVDDDAIWNAHGWVAETLPDINRFMAASPEITDELLAEVDRLRALHNEAWDLIDHLAEDLADHAPLAHDWLIDEANAWREKHPKTK